MNSLPSIELSVFARLKKDSAFRQKFFIAESSAKIAQQLISLRKRRALNQAQLAKKLKTGQPAISRVESADYLNWSFTTLRKFATELDARIRVIIEASEDVLPEYEDFSERREEHTAPVKEKAATSAASYPSGDIEEAKARGLRAGAANVGISDPPRLRQLEDQTL